MLWSKCYQNFSHGKTNWASGYESRIPKLPAKSTFQSEGPTWCPWGRQNRARDSSCTAGEMMARGWLQTGTHTAPLCSSPCPHWQCCGRWASGPGGEEKLPAPVPQLPKAAGLWDDVVLLSDRSRASHCNWWHASSRMFFFFSVIWRETRPRWGMKSLRGTRCSSEVTFPARCSQALTVVPAQLEEPAV